MLLKIGYQKLVTLERVLLNCWLVIILIIELILYIRCKQFSLAFFAVDSLIHPDICSGNVFDKQQCSCNWITDLCLSQYM